MKQGKELHLNKTTENVHGQPVDEKNEGEK